MSESQFHKKGTLPGVQPSKDASPYPPLPKKIGPYLIEGLYREGGMGLLYLATHPITKDPVIIKTLKPALSSNKEVLQKFNNEARILKMADHPNIVRLFAHAETEDGPFIALEFIQGRPLNSLIEGSPLSLKRAVEVILEIAYALCHLHTLGVIHRDLKPENILVTDTNTIKLIDLGVAQMLSDIDPSNKTAKVATQVIGTPIYMSPEQHSNPDAVSYASDVYSLGIIAYELVLGKLSYGQIHLALMPKGLQKIIAKTLQPRVEDRYQDVVDFITDLSAYLNSANVEKERKGADHLSELSSHLQRAQALMLPAEVPHWPGMDIGVSTYRATDIGGVYYDFLTLPDEQYCVILAEPHSGGVDGVIRTAIFRGMIRTLCRLTTNPVSVVTFLNDMTAHETANELFDLTYIVLSPRSNQLHYISGGPSKLWKQSVDTSAIQKLSADNPPIGTPAFTEFRELTTDWNPGDLLYLRSAALFVTSSDDSAFCNAIETVQGLRPQKQTETVLRKASTNKAQPEPHPLTLICIARI